MIDPRLQSLLSDEASAGSTAPADGAVIEQVNAPATATDTDVDTAADTDVDTADETATNQIDTTGGTTGDVPAETSLKQQVKELFGDRDQALNTVAEQHPTLLPIVEASKAGVRMDSGGSLAVSRSLRAAMDALIPGRDKAPAGQHRLIGSWLTADAGTDANEAVTSTSPWFTVSHWHWLAAKNYVRAMPGHLGPTFPHLFVSEAQVIHDLHQWGALGSNGITDEARDMFAAVTGHADITLYGTVLLYAQRHELQKVPTELAEYGLQAAVRDIPRVTFAIGIGQREAVTALVNNTTVVFDRRLRRTSESADAAAAVLRLLDPDGMWPAYPLKTPIVLPGDVTDALANDDDTAGVIDTAPDEDAPDEVRVADAERRETVRKGAKRILGATRIPKSATETIADIAACTTHALAQITVRTCDVDVSRGAPSALALAFLRERGVVASYPTGTGQWRRIIYAAGNANGIEQAVTSLRNTYRGTPQAS